MTGACAGWAAGTATGSSQLFSLPPSSPSVLALPETQIIFIMRGTRNGHDQLLNWLELGRILFQCDADELTAGADAILVE